MAKFCGHDGRQILFVTGHAPQASTCDVLPVPPELFHVEQKELIQNYEVWQGQILLKERTMASNKIRLAIVGAWDIPCGIATYTKYLREKVEDKVSDVKVFTETLPGETGFVSDTVERCWTRGKSLAELARRIKMYAPDVVHIQHEYGIFPDARHWLAFLSQLQGIPTVVTLHSVYNHEDKTICEQAVPLLLVHTDAAKATLRAKGITKPIEVVPHGCVWQPGIKRLWNLYRSERTIVQFGFGFRYKGWEHSLETVAMLKRQYPDVFFTGLFSTTRFAKDAHNQYLGELNKLVSQLGIEENVCLLPGFLEDKALSSYLRTSKVGLFPYASNPGHEVFGASGAARIAMANGLPIVGSSMHHFDDLQGVVPRPQDVAETAACVHRLFDVDEARKQVAKQDNFLQSNSWDIIASRHMAVYGQIRTYV